MGQMSVTVINANPGSLVLNNGVIARRLQVTVVCSDLAGQMCTCSLLGLGLGLGVWERA